METEIYRRTEPLEFIPDQFQKQNRIQNEDLNEMKARMKQVKAIMSKKHWRRDYKAHLKFLTKKKKKQDSKSKNDLGNGNVNDQDKYTPTHLCERLYSTLFKEGKDSGFTGLKSLEKYVHQRGLVGCERCSKKMTRSRAHNCLDKMTLSDLQASWPRLYSKCFCIFGCSTG